MLNSKAQGQSGYPWRSLAKIVRALGPLRTSPLGLAGLVVVGILLLSALLAPSIVPYDPTQIHVEERFSGPSTSHWLGTDHLGRDILSRVIVGGRVAFKVALTSISLALAFGLVLGMLAGYGPSWLDQLLLTVFDTLRSFPSIMFALAVVALVGPSLNAVILVVVVISIPSYGRIVRTSTQSLQHSDFILAERAMGVPVTRILGVHILPNVVGPLLVLASMDIPSVIGMEAGLSFLGMGVRPPTPSWGSLLNDGYSFIRNTPWPIIAGVVPLILVTLGFTFLGEALLEIIDPKRRSRS